MGLISPRCDVPAPKREGRAVTINPKQCPLDERELVLAAPPNTQGAPGPTAWSHTTAPCPLSPALGHEQPAGTGAVAPFRLPTSTLLALALPIR